MSKNFIPVIGAINYQFETDGATGAITGIVNPAGNVTPVGSIPPAELAAELAALTGNVAASRSLALADSGKTLICTSAAAIVLTIPNDATALWTGLATVGSYQGGAGAVSFAAGAGVTLHGSAVVAQYGTNGVMRVGPNEWAYI